MVFGSLFGSKTKTQWDSQTKQMPSEWSRELFDNFTPVLNDFGLNPPTATPREIAGRNPYELSAEQSLVGSAPALRHSFLKNQHRVRDGYQLARNFLPGTSNIRRLGGGDSALSGLRFSNIGDHILDGNSAVRQTDQNAMTRGDLAMALDYANNAVSSSFVQQAMQTLMNPLRDQFNAELGSNVMNAAAAGQLGSSRTALAGDQALDRFADRSGAAFSAGLTPVFNQAMQGALSQALGRGQQAISQDALIDQFELGRYDRGLNADRLELERALGLDAFANEQNRLALAQDEALDRFALGRGAQGLQYGELMRDVAPIMADLRLKRELIPAQITASLGAEQRGREQQALNNERQTALANEWMPYLMAMNNIGIGAGIPGGEVASSGRSVAKNSQGIGNMLGGLVSAGMGLLGGGSPFGSIMSMLGLGGGGAGGGGAPFMAPAPSFIPAPGGYMSGVPAYGSPFGGGGYYPGLAGALGGIIGGGSMYQPPAGVRFQ